MFIVVFLCNTFNVLLSVLVAAIVNSETGSPFAGLMAAVALVTVLSAAQSWVYRKLTEPKKTGEVLNVIRFPKNE